MTDRCTVVLNEPCNKQATRTLRPRHGTPRPLCEEHYQWLRFLEDGPKSRIRHWAPFIIAGVVMTIVMILILRLA